MRAWFLKIKIKPKVVLPGYWLFFLCVLLSFLLHATIYYSLNRVLREKKAAIVGNAKQIPRTRVFTINNLDIKKPTAPPQLKKSTLKKVHASKTAFKGRKSSNKRVKRQITPSKKKVSSKKPLNSGLNTATITTNSLQKEPRSKKPTEKEFSAEHGIPIKSYAKLIKSSFKIPQYTPEALAAGLEGKFRLSVLVDAAGVARKAKLIKKIGYQMDDHVIKAALRAKYIPARSIYGDPIPSWSRIYIILQME